MKFPSKRIKLPEFIPLAFLSLTFGTIFLLGLFTGKSLPKASPQIPSFSPTPTLKKTAWVKEVIDGDTIVLEDSEKIRYLGIDAPDQGKPYFLKAKEYNQKLVADKQINLEYEPGKDKDVFGRTLAYVFIKDEFGAKKMANLLLVEEGLANLDHYTELKYQQEFLKAREWARGHHYGIWFTEFEKSILSK